MTSWEYYENKWFYMKYIGKYLSGEILLTRECNIITGKSCEFLPPPPPLPIRIIIFFFFFQKIFLACLIKSIIYLTLLIWVEFQNLYIHLSSNYRVTPLSYWKSCEFYHQINLLLRHLMPISITFNNMIFFLYF